MRVGETWGWGSEPHSFPSDRLGLRAVWPAHCAGRRLPALALCAPSTQGACAQREGFSGPRAYVRRASSSQASPTLNLYQRWCVASDTPGPIQFLLKQLLACSAIKSSTHPGARVRFQ